MRKENLIRPAVPTQEPLHTVAERRHWNAMLRSRTLRAAVAAATLLLPSACGKSDKQDGLQAVVPAGAVVKLERIDDSLCKPTTPDGGVTNKLLNALVLTFAGAMRPSHGVERTHNPKDQRPTAIKPAKPSAGPKPTVTATTTAAPTPTTSAPRPSSATTPPATTASPSASRTSSQPRPLPAPTSASTSGAERERTITDMLPPVSATALPVPITPEVPTFIDHCEESRAYIEVSSTSEAPLNDSPNLTDPGNKAYVVGYYALLRASEAQDPLNGMYKLERDVLVLGEVL